MNLTLEDLRISNGMRAQMELRRQMLADGAHQVGWKVGMGAPALQEKLKLTAPIVGFIVDRALFASGATVPVRGWRRPVAEGRSPPISAMTCPRIPIARPCERRSWRSDPRSSRATSCAAAPAWMA